MEGKGRTSKLPVGKMSIQTNDGKQSELDQTDSVSHIAFFVAAAGRMAPETAPHASTETGLPQGWAHPHSAPHLPRQMGPDV